MKRFSGLLVALMLVLGSLLAPAMGASLVSKSGQSASSAHDAAGKKSKKTCKKLKKKIKKAKTKKAKKRARKRYNKKCKCKKLKKKAKKAKSAKARKRAKKQYQKKCTRGGGSGGGGGGGGSGGGGSGGGGSPPPTKTERTVEGTYGSPVVGIAGIGYVCGMGCVNFTPTAEEAYVSVEIIDDAGQPAGAALAQDTNGDGVGDIFATVCGKTDKPIPITPGLDLTVAVGAGVVVDANPIPPGACPSVATTGTVKVTFSNLP